MYTGKEWILNRSWLILAELDVCQRWGERGRLAVSERGEMKKGDAAVATGLVCSEENDSSLGSSPVFVCLLLKVIS